MAVQNMTLHYPYLEGMMIYSETEEGLMDPMFPYIQISPDKFERLLSSESQSQLPLNLRVVQEHIGQRSIATFRSD